MRGNSIDEREFRFVVLLCGDVLIEIFQFGTRHRLSKLERVGRRFYRMVERYFVVTPYLRLNLLLTPRGDGNGKRFLAFSKFNNLILRY